MQGESVEEFVSVLVLVVLVHGVLLVFVVLESGFVDLGDRVSPGRDATLVAYGPSVPVAPRPSNRA